MICNAIRWHVGVEIAWNIQTRTLVLWAMPDDAVPQAERLGLTTWIGLFIALFGLFLIRQAFRIVSHDPGTALVVVRELTIFASAGALLMLMKRREKLPLRTIGLGTSVWWKSALWGLVTMLLCGGATELLGMVTKAGVGQTSPYDRLPPWLFILIIFRASIVEELFYRGYAIERLRALGAGRFASAAIPLFVFAGGHYSGAWPDVLQPLVLGCILTGFYLWRRDLAANILAHTLVDLVGTGVLVRIMKSV
jgi:membrane protease YdiL (CAAX protease family)